MVGYDAAFDASRNAWHYTIIYLGDLMYLINTVLYFLTAIKDNGKVIRDRNIIYKKNLNVYFVFDVVSLLPLEIFGFASSNAFVRGSIAEIESCTANHQSYSLFK